jgi:hypothetical protein
MRAVSRIAIPPRRLTLHIETCCVGELNTWFLVTIYDGSAPGDEE